MRFKNFKVLKRVEKINIKKSSNIQMKLLERSMGIELEYLYNLIKKIPKKYRKQFNIGVNNKVPIIMTYEKLNDDLKKFMKKDYNYGLLITHLYNFSDFIISNLNYFNKKQYDKLTKFEGVIESNLLKKVEEGVLKNISKYWDLKIVDTNLNVEIIHNKNELLIKVKKGKDIVGERRFNGHISKKNFEEYIQNFK